MLPNEYQSSNISCYGQIIAESNIEQCVLKNLKNKPKTHTNKKQTNKTPQFLFQRKNLINEASDKVAPTELQGP